MATLLLESNGTSPALSHLPPRQGPGTPGKLDEAVAELRTAIRITPNDAEAHYLLGKALALQGKRDGAIAELRNARDNAPRGSEFAELIEKALNDLDH